MDVKPRLSPAGPPANRKRLALLIPLARAFLWLACGGQPTAPEIDVRNAHAMTYDGKRVILFGGADATQVRGDTWGWDGQRWSLLDTAGPEPRTFPAMTYDSLRKRVVLFGGNRVLFGKTPDDNRYLRDTWEWDGEGWKRVSDSGPPPRAEAAVAFDSKRRRVVLFGGYNRVGGEIHRLGDTWEWDGSEWMEIRVEGPSPRNGAAQVYDDALERVVLFGGSTDAGVSAETWEWDGRFWRANHAAVTEGRFNSVLAYDAGRAKVIRFGGRFSGKPFGDTWEYDGQVWTRLSSSGPSPRNHTAMAYDGRRARVVLFGGHNFGVREEGVDVFGDTWEWDPDGWVRTRDGQTRPSVDNGH